MAIIVFITFGQSVFAVETETENEKTPLADYLKEIGLFQGTGSGYELQGIANRAQAAVMVVRLLGKEAEAIAANLQHPFTDVPNWASPYVGYLWTNGLTKGVGETLYGSEQLINANQYMTFMLRTLTYSDQLGDFQWDTSIQKGNELGIISEVNYNYFSNQKNFLRGDMVLLSYITLGGEMKGDGESLLKKLIDQDVVPLDAIMGYKKAPYMAMPTSYDTNTLDGFKKAFISAIVHYETDYTIDMKDSKVSDLDAAFDEALVDIQQVPGYSSTLDGWEWFGSTEQLTVGLEYRISEEVFNQATAAAQTVVAGIVLPDSTDYSLEKAFHDYIVNGTVYHLVENQDAIYTIAGVFVDKQAVCQGYADALFYLCSLSGVESYLVFGDGDTDGELISHAWNIVEIEGIPYQIDTTWDDPATDNGEQIIQYVYFNITDAELDLDHNWDQAGFPISIDTQHNYYAVNGLMVENSLQLTAKLQEGFYNLVTRMEFKVSNEKITMLQLESILDSLYGWRGCNFFIYEDRGIVIIDQIVY